MTDMTRHLICSIYRSSRQDEMYLYVDKTRGLGSVPEALMSRFGAPKHVADMLLRPEKPLARVDVEKVRAALREQGWFLQMPPPPEPDLYLAKGHPGRGA
jgi:uncharacterized protein